ncbi:MAG: S-layer family protein [Xenococcaceae cyanobacterium MO_188.B32]|nr:S-layer family protein [Xenococcaceae cyanobacterium MO_188.B32]
MKLILSSLVFFSLAPSTAVAQITPDSSLGTENSIVETNGNRDTINGGAIRDANLFHSFQEFNVDALREAYFTNPDGIANIFSRVTGNNISDIQGVLGVLGNANLYLINPNGILFGENARLDVNGSFFATTADSVVFGNGFEFSAVNPDAPPLLTINIPIGLRFRDNPGDIVNRSVAHNGNGLQVATGETITLIGGNVNIANGGIISAPGGRVELGSVDDNEQVSLTAVDKGWRLGYEDVHNFRNIQLSQGVTVDASGQGGGEVQIQGARLVMGNLSEIIADTLGNRDGGDILIQATDEIVLDNATISAEVSEQATGSGGNITIKTRQLSIINGEELGVISTPTLGEGDAGNLTVETERLVIRDGGQLTADTVGIGNAGNLTVRASESVEVSGTSTDGRFRSGLFAETSSTDSNAGDGGELTITTGQLLVQDGAAVAVETRGAGDGGNLKIDTRQLSIRNGGQVSAGTLGTPSTGQGGSITVNASEFVEVIGTRCESPSGLFAPTFGAADGGDLTITTRSLSVREGGTISTSTLAVFAEGRGGDLTINASESVEVIGTSEASEENKLFSSIVTETGRLLNVVSGTEPAIRGNLTINTGRLTISDGARVSTSTFGLAGKAGNLNVNALESVDLLGMDEDGNISTLTTTTKGAGDAGTLRINTGRLFIRDGAQISAATSADGNGGNVIINVSDSLFVDGIGSDGNPSSIFARSFGDAEGDAGSVDITTNSLFVTNQAQVNVSGSARGNGGNIKVEVNSIKINQGTLEAETAFGEGGNIMLQIADDLTLRDNSTISAQATSNANGGNVTINAEFIVAFPNQNNDIIASAEQGMGGNINITAESIFGLEERRSTPPNNTNDIDASSEFGLSGTVNITQPDVNPTSGLLDLTQEVVNASDLIAQNVCTQTANSEFVDIGKGGLPQNPEYTLVEDATEVELVSPVMTSGEEIETKRETIDVKPKKTLKPPAQGWIFHENGIVELVAYNPDRVGEQRTWDNYRGCQ